MSTVAKTNGHCDGGIKENVNEGFEEVQIPVPWGHISGKWWGSKSSQPVIALHGWQDNAGTFDELAPLLKEKRISLLCIDLPGQGFSSHLPKGQFYYIFWDGVHYLRRIIKYFNWKNVTLMGHSLGGGISFLYASIFPDEVKKYISLDIACPPVYGLRKLKDVERAAVDAFFKFENMSRSSQPRYTYSEALDLMLSGHKGSLTRNSAEIMLKRGMLPDDKNPEKYFFTRDPSIKFAVLASFSKEQVLNYARRIKCKVLNIRAVPGHSFEFPEIYDQVLEVLEEVTDLERHAIEGTHHLHLNNPEAISDIIINFIKS